MMKKNRHILLKSLIMFIMAAFTFTSAFAQEEKEEKKLIKVKVMADEDGNISIDTSFVLDEDFDGDWKALIKDEELLEKLESIEIDLDLDEDGNIYLIKSPHTTQKTYFYSADTDDDGKVTIDVEVESGDEDIHEIIVKEIDGDSTMTIVLKSAGCKKEENEYIVMIWHDMDGEEEITHDIIMEQIDGDSCKVVIMTTGDGGTSVSVIKKKEVIIITEEVEEHEHDHDHDKDKKKKKKKKDDD